MKRSPTSENARMLPSERIRCRQVPSTSIQPWTEDHTGFPFISRSCSGESGSEGEYSSVERPSRKSVDTPYNSAIFSNEPREGDFRPPSQALNVGCETPNRSAASISLRLFSFLASLNCMAILLSSCLFVDFPISFRIRTDSLNDSLVF